MKRFLVCPLAVLCLLLYGCGDDDGSGPDTTPDAFSFVDQDDVARSTPITSAPVTITGINTAAQVSVTGGTYSIGCGTDFTAAPGTINNNETVCVQHTSADMASAATDTTLTVGGVTDTFTSTVAAPATGEVMLMSSGAQRSFYLIVPPDYDASSAVKPLLFAYHGTGGRYRAWLNGSYDLVPTVGDEAIVVLPQALPDTNGVRQWNYAYDLQYFQDMLAYVEANLSYDRERVFVTGHSSGGGMAHELGCNFGDRIRGIAVHAGILRSTQCVGAVAVLQTHHRYDTLVPPGTSEAGHQFWVLYNGFEYGMSTAGIHPSCIDHSLGGSPYPMQWCLHEDGDGTDNHRWPSFASAATWQFFSGLSREAETTNPPAGGGNSKVASLVDTTLSFTLVYPAGIGRATQGSVGLYPGGTRQPLSGGPNSILRLSFDPGAVGPGSEVHYEVPIKYGNESFPGTYTFAVVMYVADGGNPIPYVGRDHIVLFDVEVVDRSTPVVIDSPLLLEPVGG